MDWRMLLFALLLIPGLAPGSEHRLPAHDSNQPRILFRPEEGSHRYPAFVSADAALATDGTIDKSLFSPEAVDSIRNLLATSPQGGCIRAENYYESYVDPPPRATLGQAVRSSHLILLGTVVDKTFGFSGFTPGQLLHVRPDQTLKGSAQEDMYFVFVPVGDFSVGAFRICKTDTRYATPPEIGEQLLALVPKLWNSDQPNVFLNTFDEAGVLTIKKDESLRFPRRYEKADGMPMHRQELLQMIRSLAGTEQ
jgi:hypothetical protein